MGFIGMKRSYMRRIPNGRTRQRHCFGVDPYIDQFPALQRHSVRFLAESCQAKPRPRRLCIVNKESNSPGSGASCEANDWACGGKGLLIWGPAAVVIIAGDLWTSARPWLWFAGFLVAGLACLANAARCGRWHCYFTGPLFLLAAVYNALAGFHLVPTNETVFLEVVVGAGVLARLSELVLGRYRKKS
jgi:hypothetical protein